MHDFNEKIKADLDKGFSKTQLEILIGLPLNSLSGIMAGKKKLSKKSILRFQRWNESEKPDPLTVKVVRKPSEKTSGKIRNKVSKTAKDALSKLMLFDEPKSDICVAKEVVVIKEETGHTLSAAEQLQRRIDRLEN